jgi:DNA repair protein RecO (recombination protein O)
MALVATPALVLQTYRYSETSKVVRLATRELGVQSAIAKGALRPRSRFGAGIEFLSEGDAQLYFRDSRELQTLAAFDVTNLRRVLALDLARFSGAAALAEVMMKMAPPAPLAAAYDVLVQGLDLLVEVPADSVAAAAVRALWLLTAVLGFGPSLQVCVRDGAAITSENGATIAFDGSEGGVLCASCARMTHAPTQLPPSDYHALLALNDAASPLPELDLPHAAAHRRLVARFVRHHLDAAPASLTALESWERHTWRTPSAS